MAIPQYAMPHVGSFCATAANASLAFSYQKEWSIATALVNNGRTEGSQETWKFTLPSFPGSAGGCSCWATAGGTNDAYTPTNSTMGINASRFMMVPLIASRFFRMGFDGSRERRLFSDA